MDWLNNYIWPAEGKWVSDEFVYDASLLAMAEMIRCGTTCFNDMYFFLGATAQAAELAGMRAHIGMTVIDVPTAWAKTTDEYFAKAIEFYQQYKNNERITPTFAPHSTYTVSIENLEKVKQLADEYQLKINIHLQEAPSEMNNRWKNMANGHYNVCMKSAWCHPDLIAIHMTQINEAILKFCRKPNPTSCIALNPI